jgi:small-conductance mechanosensitive channel
MSINLVGLDLNALGNMTAPHIDIPQTANEILQNFPLNANEMTGGLFPYLVLFTIFIITYWYLSDKNPLADFKYSDIRALTLSFGITASIGITQITIGFIQSWMAVVFFILAFVLSNVILILIENKD